MLAQLLLTIILLPQGKLILWWTNKVEDREEKSDSRWHYWSTGPILFQNPAYFWATTFSLLFKPVWVKFYLKLEVFLTLNHNHLNTVHLKISVFHVFSCVQLSAAPLTVAHKASPVHRIFQARILEWVAISYSRVSSWPGIGPTSPAAPALAGQFFTTRAAWEAPYVSQLHGRALVVDLGLLTERVCMNRKHQDSIAR